MAAAEPGAGGNEHARHHGFPHGSLPWNQHRASRQQGKRSHDGRPGHADYLVQAAAQIPSPVEPGQQAASGRHQAQGDDRVPQRWPGQAWAGEVMDRRCGHGKPAHPGDHVIAGLGADPCPAPPGEHTEASWRQRAAWRLPVHVFPPSLPAHQLRRPPRGVEAVALGTLPKVF